MSTECEVCSSCGFLKGGKHDDYGLKPCVCVGEKTARPRGRPATQICLCSNCGKIYDSETDKSWRKPLPEGYEPDQARDCAVCSDIYEMNSLSFDE